MDTLNSPQHTARAFHTTAASIRSGHDTAWSHRHQRATDAVVQTFARSLSSRQASGPHREPR
jgi:hypothetical protein